MRRALYLAASANDSADAATTDTGRRGEGAALAQLEERGEADKYRASGEPIYLIGVEFSRDTRTVSAFAVEHV